MTVGRSRKRLTSYALNSPPFKPSSLFFCYCYCFYCDKYCFSAAGPAGRPVGRLLIANLTSCYIEITFTLQSSPFPRTFTDLTQYSFQTNQSQDSWYLLSDFGHKNLPDFKVVVDKMEDHREHVLYTENKGDMIIF